MGRGWCTGDPNRSRISSWNSKPRLKSSRSMRSEEEPIARAPVGDQTAWSPATIDVGEMVEVMVEEEGRAPRGGESAMGHCHDLWIEKC